MASSVRRKWRPVRKASLPRAHRHQTRREQRNMKNQNLKYFSTHFTNNHLLEHIRSDHYDLPIRSENGDAHVIAHLLKGVDSRATITTSWSELFHPVNMKEENI